VAPAGDGRPGLPKSCGGKKEMKNKTKKETFYIVRCKSNGNFWHESLDDFLEELDHHSFEDSPLGAVRVGQDPGDFEEELEVIKKSLPKGEFDASDFELVKVDVSYTLSPP
jgi:hypothetical protein